MIKINDRYYIDADEHCYMLKEARTIKDKKSKNYGKSTYKTLGYHSTIDFCLNGLIKKELREFISKSEEKGIKDLIQKMKELEEFIDGLDLKR